VSYQPVAKSQFDGPHAAGSQRPGFARLSFRRIVMARKQIILWVVGHRVVYVCKISAIDLGGLGIQNAKNGRSDLSISLSERFPRDSGHHEI
jgi:hypothetical protein